MDLIDFECMNRDHFPMNRLIKVCGDKNLLVRIVVLELLPDVTQLKWIMESGSKMNERNSCLMENYNLVSK
jgi:hypothetical protein